jgi:hypothetical protein
MVLVCKNINERFNINTYHHNLIKNKAINTYDIINKNAHNNKINKENLENFLTRIHYDDIKEITEYEHKNMNLLINRTIRKEMFFIQNFIKIKN